MSTEMHSVDAISSDFISSSQMMSSKKRKKFKKINISSEEPKQSVSYKKIKCKNKSQDTEESQIKEASIISCQTSLLSSKKKKKKNKVREETSNESLITLKNYDKEKKHHKIHTSDENKNCEKICMPTSQDVLHKNDSSKLYKKKSQKHSSAQNLLPLNSDSQLIIPNKKQRRKSRLEDSPFVCLSSESESQNDGGESIIEREYAFEQETEDVLSSTKNPLRDVSLSLGFLTMSQVLDSTSYSPSKSKSFDLAESQTDVPPLCFDLVEKNAENHLSSKKKKKRRKKRKNMESVNSAQNFEFSCLTAEDGKTKSSKFEQNVLKSPQKGQKHEAHEISLKKSNKSNSDIPSFEGSEENSVVSLLSREKALLNKNNSKIKNSSLKIDEPSRNKEHINSFKKSKKKKKSVDSSSLLNYPSEQETEYMPRPTENPDEDISGFLTMSQVLDSTTGSPFKNKAISTPETQSDLPTIYSDLNERNASDLLSQKEKRKRKKSCMESESMKSSMNVDLTCSSVGDFKIQESEHSQRLDAQSKKRRVSKKFQDSLKLLEKNQDTDITSPLRNIKKSKIYLQSSLDKPDLFENQVLVQVPSFKRKRLGHHTDSYPSEQASHNFNDVPTFNFTVENSDDSNLSLEFPTMNFSSCETKSSIKNEPKRTFAKIQRNVSLTSSEKSVENVASVEEREDISSHKEKNVTPKKKNCSNKESIQCSKNGHEITLARKLDVSSLESSMISVSSTPKKQVKVTKKFVGSEKHQDTNKATDISNCEEPNKEDNGCKNKDKRRKENINFLLSESTGPTAPINSEKNVEVGIVRENQTEPDVSLTLAHNVNGNARDSEGEDLLSGSGSSFSDYVLESMINQTYVRSGDLENRELHDDDGAINEGNYAERFAPETEEIYGAEATGSDDDEEEDANEQEDQDKRIFMRLKDFKIVADFDVPEEHTIEDKLNYNIAQTAKKRFIALDMIPPGRKFSPIEDKTIIENWKTFCKKYNFDVKESYFFSKIRVKNRYTMDYSEYLKFAQFIGQGLPKRRLCSIHTRFVNLTSTYEKEGRFTSAEDKVILDYLKETNGHNKTRMPFKALSSILGRSNKSILKRSRTLQQETCRIKGDTHIIEKQLRYILKYTYCSKISEIKDKEIPWKSINDRSKIKGYVARGLWWRWLSTCLHTKETLYMRNIQASLLALLLRRTDITSLQEVKWTELANNFKGVNSVHLSVLFHEMKNLQPKRIQEMKWRDMLLAIKNEWIPVEMIKGGVALQCGVKFRPLVYKDGTLRGRHKEDDDTVMLFPIDWPPGS